LSDRLLSLRKDPRYVNHQQERVQHWDGVAQKKDSWKGAGGYYHRRLEQIYRFLVPPGQRVLEIGCGNGDLLAALQPSYGVGVDFSGENLGRACERYPHLRFLPTDAHELELDETFDVIILSDTLN
jgi:ubiquinone/menaquinone biosynthesis C-methylase UbiE